jgi:threonine synthase
MARWICLFRLFGKEKYFYKTGLTAVSVKQQVFCPSCRGGNTSAWYHAHARQAQRIGSEEMPLTMMDAVRRGGAASSADSSRGSKAFSSARISSRAMWAPMQ